jgi:hypothetical protein
LPALPPLVARLQEAPRALAAVPLAQQAQRQAQAQQQQQELMTMLLTLAQGPASPERLSSFSR